MVHPLPVRVKGFDTPDIRVVEPVADAAGIIKQHRKRTGVNPLNLKRREQK
jgi:hypothetical protein